MASIAELKKRIDMPDLARRLGLKEGKGGKEGALMFHSPGHKDSTASLSVSLVDGIWLYKDWSNPDGAHARGTVVDLVIYAGQAHDTAEAMRLLHEWYSIPFDKTDDKQKEEKSMVEWLAEKCLANTDPVVEYLKSRGISDLAIAGALKGKAIGFNDWTSTKVSAGTPGHGGPAAAFIVRTLNPGKIVAVDFRYLDADLNGGAKTQCQGEKLGYGWTSDIKRLHGAKTVYIVESPVNALSVETAFPTERHIAAFSIRGTGNVDNIDFSFLRGKQVRICLDHRDRVNQKTGYRPGLKSAWDLHEKLATMDIAALLVDQSGWEEGEDLNDVLQREGQEGTSRALKLIEPWLIPGLPGKEESAGKRRVFLPPHDYSKYWTFRVKDDHTQVVTKFTPPENEEDEPKLEFGDLCGFRVASLSRVAIQSASATMTGDPDSMPRVQFAVSVQTPRHGASLQRKVFDDEDLHNLTRWEKFGPIYTPASMKRMINILERTAEIGSRRAVNFVGLAWRDGELSANEGHQTYFTEPDKQCPYFNLAFPRGSEADARQVIEAFGRTMKQNAATLLLAWSLGGHLKQFLGFWPHMEMQANKGAGKSTLVKKLERAIAFSMLSGQSLQTEFRLVTSVSHTTHPVGWEELSTRRNEIIEKAVALLQETYQYTVNRRGSDMTEFLLCAPVLLAGEEVKADTLTGKLVRTDLTGKKGDPIPDTVPRFPVWNWLQWLAKLNKSAVLEKFEANQRFCQEGCCASAEDDGAARMVRNYAALLTAWELLTEFCGMPDTWNAMPRDLLAEMNRHIKETEATREPWVWIVEILLSEISRGNYQHPYKWETVKNENGEGEFCLCVRASHVMDHIAHTPALRDKYNALPIKTDRVFKKQLINAGVVHNPDFETSRGTTRMPHYMALSKDALERFGLYATFSNDNDTGSNH